MKSSSPLIAAAVTVIKTGIAKVFQYEVNKKITVLHYPPGTRKWNKIEHRLLAFLSKNWQGIPLTNTALVVSLIGATTTATGLTVTWVLDESKDEKGIKITDEDFNKINIKNADFHGEWNYTVSKKLVNFIYKQFLRL
jgi:hypothetical protein